MEEITEHYEWKFPQITKNVSILAKGKSKQKEQKSNQKELFEWHKNIQIKHKIDFFLDESCPIHSAISKNQPLIAEQRR